MPFIELREEKLWANAGVIGMPANDGTRRGWYLLVRDGAADLEFSLRSFDYDAELAACLMDEQGLPCEYAATLRNGLWCSLDNLPAAEQAQRGIPLCFAPIHFPKTGFSQLFVEGGKAAQ